MGGDKLCQGLSFSVPGFALHVDQGKSADVLLFHELQEERSKGDSEL